MGVRVIFLYHESITIATVLRKVHFAFSLSYAMLFCCHFGTKCNTATPKLALSIDFNSS